MNSQEALTTLVDALKSNGYAVEALTLGKHTHYKVEDVDFTPAFTKDLDGEVFKIEFHVQGETYLTYNLDVQGFDWEKIAREYRVVCDARKARKQAARQCGDFIRSHQAEIRAIQEKYGIKDFGLNVNNGGLEVEGLVSFSKAEAFIQALLGNPNSD